MVPKAETIMIQMPRAKKIEFVFKFDDGLEQWFWHKTRNTKTIDSSPVGFDLKTDCINDAIINGYENGKC